MQPLAFYSAILGTFLSIFSLTLFTRRQYASGQAASVSMLALANKKTLRQFRTILWVCGSLIAVTLLFFIAQRLHSDLLYQLWAVTWVCELLTGVIPTRGGWLYMLHSAFAYGMALGFFITAAYFAYHFTGGYQLLSTGIFVLMSIMILSTFVDRKHFLFYELSYIFLSHIGVIIAALALK